jgi:hypothetical protein
MTQAQIVELVGGWPHVLVFTPGPNDGSPEIAWGDNFFYYAPDGIMPTTTQPFATIVTKNYPGDEQSQLDRDGVFRVNIHPSKKSFTRHVSTEAADFEVDAAAALDRIIEHPVYGSLGWVAVLNPGQQSLTVTRELLREAYELDQRRYERRHPSL